MSLKIHHLIHDKTGYLFLSITYVLITQQSEMDIERTYFPLHLVENQTSMKPQMKIMVKGPRTSSKLLVQQRVHIGGSILEDQKRKNDETIVIGSTKRRIHQLQRKT